MLEQSGSAMADDVCRKTELIKFYCMEAGRTEAPGRGGGATGGGSVGPSNQHSLVAGADKMKQLMKLVNTDQADQHKREVQRMQQMLEETLTKNMFLQKNMDTLSQEVVTLSKQLPSATEDE